VTAWGQQPPGRSKQRPNRQTRTWKPAKGIKIMLLKKWWNTKSFKTQNLIKGAVGMSLGAAAGFAYYSFSGCSTGTCPITSNPVISTAWGALIGGALTIG
jgi:hypothetical protein